MTHVTFILTLTYPYPVSDLEMSPDTSQRITLLKIQVNMTLFILGNRHCLLPKINKPHQGDGLFSVSSSIAYQREDGCETY